MTKKCRLQIDFTEEAYKELEDLQSCLDAPSKSEVIQTPWEYYGGSLKRSGRTTVFWWRRKSPQEMMSKGLSFTLLSVL
jgi:hypothetical protein